MYVMYTINQSEMKYNYTNVKFISQNFNFLVYTNMSENLINTCIARVLSTTNKYSKSSANSTIK